MSERPRSRNAARYWNAEGWPGLSCLEAKFTSQYFAPHSHEALVIAVTEAGGSAYRSRGRSAEASRAELLVFNPVEPHAGHMRDSRYWHYRGLYLAEPALTRLLRELGGVALPGFTRNAIGDPDLIAAFTGVHRELDGGDAAGARERMIAACGRLFAYADGQRRPAADSADREIVDRALSTIRERSRHGVSLDELASSAGLSTFQLIRHFNRLTGMPPHAHLVRHRLHDALRQLTRGRSLSEAAQIAGFYDQSAFTRHFRAAYGLTPGQYVAARRR